MKKLLVLFLSLFFVFGIISCNRNNPNEIEYNLNEQLGVPSNLEVNETTRTLTWDDVEHAIRYNVYVDGELEDEVTSSSFDFSDLTGDKLVFTVKAMAPKGMQNSNVSTTIAFVANRESEIEEMKLSIESRNMSVNDEDAFATELVNKGMLSEDFNAMMDNMEDLETIGDLNDVSEIYNEFDQLIDSMDMIMIEALISSLIKVELKANLQYELDFYKTLEPYPGILQIIEQHENLLEFIDENGDEAVKSAMIVIEYLIDVQEGIDTELVNNIETLVDSNDLTSTNISLMVNVKNDLINNLKDNMPELQDVIVLNSTLVAFMQAVGDLTVDMSVLSIPKQSAQSLMSMELFYNYILEMDEDYVSALVEASESTSTMATKPFVKENISLMDEFLENNDGLIQQFNNIYSEEDKEVLFYDFYIDAITGSYYTNMFGTINPTINDEIQTIIEEQIDFDNVLLLQARMSESFNDLLDAIIESDYAIIDAYYDVAQLSSEVGVIHNDDFGGLDFGIITTLQPGEYQVTVRTLSYYEEGPYEFYILADYGQGYEIIQSSSETLIAGEEDVFTFTLTEAAEVHTYAESNMDTYGTLEKVQSISSDEMTETEAVGNLMKETVALWNPILQDVTVEEYTALIDLVFGQLIVQFEIQELNMDNQDFTYFSEIVSLMAYYESGFKNTAENQLNILKDMVDLLDQTNYIDDFVDLYNATDEFNDSNEYYGAMILLANAYLDFYSDSQNDIDAIIEELMLVLNEPDVRIHFQITTNDLEEIETTINNFFTDLTDQANIIKDYDYNNLTSAQRANVDAFVSVMVGFAYMM
ncbi:MAG: hypothetical protein ACLFPM_03115 [Candidatus Izemoplasmatales bacterium]